MTIPQLLSRATPGLHGCLLLPRQGTRRYVEVQIDGRKESAHRAVYRYYHGEIPRGMEVCHTCDNTLCIARDHLVLGTHSENMRDRDRKGRNGTMGTASPLSKLTDEKVIEIYHQARSGGDKRAIAEQFGISVATVKRISNRETWRHILKNENANH